jgi:hypothetical protein
MEPRTSVPVSPRVPRAVAPVRLGSRLSNLSAIGDRRLQSGRGSHLASWAAEYAALPLPAPWAAASAAGCVSGLLYAATATSVWPTVAVVGVCQLLLIGSWIKAMASRAPLGLAIAGTTVALLADAVALRSPELSLEYIPLVGVAGFTVTLLIQFWIRPRREVIFALGEAVQLQLAVLGLATLIVLADDLAGAVAGSVAVAAAGVSVVVAQLTDSVTRRPAVHPAVPRGWPGIVLGIAAGSGVGAALLPAGGVSVTAETSLVALGATLGGVVALVATLVDVASGYELVGRAVWAPIPTLSASSIGSGRRFAALPTGTAVAVAMRGPLLAVAFGVAIGYVVTSLLPFS